jgi:hypothetical protein
MIKQLWVWLVVYVLMEKQPSLKPTNRKQDEQPTILTGVQDGIKG